MQTKWALTTAELSVKIPMTTTLNPVKLPIRFPLELAKPLCTREEAYQLLGYPVEWKPAAKYHALLRFCDKHFTGGITSHQVREPGGLFRVADLLKAAGGKTL